MGATLLVCLLLAVGTLGGPINNKVERPETSCARHCKANTKFFYKPRTTYGFDYVVDTKTSIEGASEDHALLQLRANAAVEVLSPCDFSLKLTNVQLFESDPNQPSRLINADREREFQRSLEKNPLRFSFQDGEVEELCPNESDPIWVLNIKRGVLSAFQNKMDSFEKDQKTKEVDVAGRCDVEYRKGASSWGTITIEKKKHLLGCDERHGYQSALQSSTYRVPSEIQSLPLMKSTHNCQQVITTSGQLQSSSCHEFHVFRPFAQGPNGAVTETKQKLTFKHELNGVSRPEKIRQRSSLLFEHNNGDNQENRRSELVSKLNEICKNTMDGIQTDTPRLFADLVYLMKAANEQTLQNIASQIERGVICRTDKDKIKKFYNDALPMVGTESSVSIMADNIAKNTVTGAEADMWLTSLAFIQNPTSNMIRHAKRLLKTSDNAMLSVSSLVNNFCQKNSCENNYEVEHIVSTLEKMIGSTCYVTNDNIEKVLVSLRSIGNIGYAKTALSTINNCLRRKDNPMVARVSAAESFRRMPCDHDRDSLVRIFTTRDEDSELRIAAYLGMMKCPSDHIISIVRRTLESEEVNQLGSFVWSHLTNLMETSDPHLQAVRAILNDENLRKEFDIDKRKFSKNYEGSFHFDRINTGARVDSNLIWSSRSFIPRSAMLNVTVNLFGKAVNLFEVGGRVEGLEYLLESYLGPKGYFGEDNGAAKYNPKAITNLSGDKINKMNNKFEKKLEDLRAAMYLRVFGNELRYKDVNGIASLLSDNLNIFDILIQLQKEQNYHFSQSLMFLDSSMIIPTAAGFPLNLTVNGTATVELEAVGKCNMKKLLSSSPTVDIDGHIRPSGAVQIAGMMSVDAFTTKNGLKMVSTTHSKTLLKGHIKIANGEVFSSEWEVPDKEMDIFSFKTAFFTVHRDVEREQKMITDNSRSHKLCTGEKLADITGLQLCGSIQYPNASLQVNSPYFPLTGPVNIGVTLHRRDDHTSYRLQSKFLLTKQDLITSINFDTPGAKKVDRAIGIEATLNGKEGTLEAALHSPWKNARFTGSLPGNRVIQGKLVVDKKEYAAFVKLQREKTKAYVRYTPRMEIRLPDRDPIIIVEDLMMKARRVESEFTATGVPNGPISLKATYANTNTEKGMTGSLSYAKGKEYYVEMRLIQNFSRKRSSFSYAPVLIIRVPHPKKDNASKEIIQVDGSLRYVEGNLMNFELKIDKVLKSPLLARGQLSKTVYTKKNRHLYRHRINIQSPALKVNLRGQVDNRNFKNMQYKMNLDYNARGLKRNRVLFNGKILNKSSKNLLRGAVNGIFTMTRFPEYNVNLKSKMSHNKRYSEVTSAIKYGDSNPQKSIDFHVKSKHVISSRNPNNVNLDALFKHPGMNIDWQLKGNHQNDGESIETSGKLQYSKGKVISGNLDLINNKKRNLKAATLNVEYPGGKIYVKDNLVQKNDTYIHKLNMILPKLGKTKIESTLSMPKKREYNFNTDMDIPQLRPIHLDGKLNMNLKDFNTAATVRYGKQAYTLKGHSKIIGNSFDGEFHIMHPSRHIQATVKADKKGEKRTGNAEVFWDADNDNSKHVSAGADLVYRAGKKIDSTLKLQYPSRSVQVNLKNIFGPKMSTHLEAEWSPKDRAILDVAFSRKSSKEIETMEGTLNIINPFTKNINAEFSARSDRNEVSSVGKVSWAKDKVISSKMLIKKPISLRRFRGTWKVNTPFEGLEKLEADIKHKADTALSSTLKAGIGKHEVEIILSGSKGDGSKRDVSGQLEIHSNIKPLKMLVIRGEHKDDGSVFHNKLAVRYNAKKYSYDFDMKHNGDGWKMHNTGELNLAVPGQSYRTEWKHKHSDGELATSVSHGSKKNKWVELEVLGHNRVTDKRHIAGTINLKTVSKKLHNIHLNFDNKIGTEMMQNSATVRSNNRKVFYIENNLSKSDKGIDSNFNMHTSLFKHKVNIKMESNAQYEQYPIAGHVQFQWSPSDKIIMDTSFSKHEDGQFNGNVRFSSPFKMAKLFSASAVRQRENNKWQTTSSIVIAPKKEIEMRLIHPIEHSRNMELVLVTPFEDFRRLHASYNNEGDWNGMSTEATFKLVPHVQLINMNAAWKLMNGLQAHTKITTPFEAMPRFSASLNLHNAGQQKKMDAKVEYQKDKEIVLTGLADINSLRNFNTEVLLITPFKRLERMKLMANHNGDIKNFKSNVGVELINHKNTNFGITFNSRNGMTLGIVTSSPLYKDINVQINHDKSHSSMKGDAIISYDRRPILNGKISLASQPKYSAGIIIKKSFIDGLENIEAMVDHQVNSPWNFISNGKLIHNGKESVASANINLEDGVNTIIELNTPEHKIDASLNHDGNFDSFNTRAAAEYNKKKIQTELLFRRSPETSVTFSLQTPFEQMKNVQSTVTLNIEQRQLQSRGELNLNGDMSTGNVNINLNRGVNGRLIIRTPYRSVRRVVFNLGHQGTFDNFKTELAATYNRKSLKGDVTFSLSPEITLVVSAESPFSLMRNLNGQYTLSGDLSNLQSKYELNLNGDQMSGDFSLRTVNGIDGRVSMKSPYDAMRNVDVMVSHQGRADDFKTELAATYNRESVKGDVAFKLRPDLVVVVSAQTPFDLMRNMNGKYTLSGDLSNLQNRFELNMNGDQMSGDLFLRSINGIDGRLSLKTPYDAMRNVDVMVNHRGRADDFKTEAAATYNRESVKGDVSFQLRPDLTVVVSAQTPFRLMRNLNGQYILSGELRNLQNKFELNLNGDHMSGELSLQSADGLDGKLSLKTPYDPIRNMDVTVKHQGSMDNFKTEVGATYNRESVNGDLTFRLRPDVVLVVAAETPFSVVRNLNGQFSLAGELNNFQNRIELNLNGDQMSSDLSLRSNNGVECKVSVKTPYEILKEADVVFNHQGSLNDFQTSSSASYNGQQIRGDVSLRNINNPTITVDIVTPFTNFRNLHTSLSHQGSASNFKTQGEYSLNYRRTIADLTFEMGDGITGSLNIESPYTVKRFNSDFHHKWTPNNLESQANVNIDGREARGNIKFTTQPDISGSISVQTPFAGYRDMSANFNHNGNRDKFQTHCDISSDDKKWMADLKVNTIGIFDTSFTITTPRTTGQVTATIDGELNDFKSQIEMTCYDYRLLATTSFVMSDNIELHTKVTTPFATVKELNIDFSHSGRLHHFKTSLESTLNHQSVSGAVAFNGEDDIELSANLNTPYTEAMKSQFTLSGPTSNFRCNGNIQYGQETASFDSSLSTSPTYEGSLIINIPVSEYETTKVTFNLDTRGDKKSLETSIHYGNGQKIRLETDVDTSNGISASVLLRSPYLKTIRGSVNHAGSFRKFKSQAAASHGRDRFEVNGNVNIEQGITGELQISVLSKDVFKVVFNNQGDLTDLTSHIEGQYFDKKFEYDFAYRLGDDSRLLLNIISPLYQPLKVTMNNRVSTQEVRTTLSILYGGKTVSLDATMNRNPYNKGSITVTTPIDGYETTTAVYNLDLADNNMILNGYITYGNGKKINVEAQYDLTDGYKGSFKLSSPYHKNIKLYGNHEGHLTDFKHKLEFGYGDDSIECEASFSKNQNIEGKFLLNAYSKNVLNTAFSFRGKPSDFTSHLEATLFDETAETDVMFKITDDIAVTITVKTPFERYRDVRLMYTHKGTLNDFSCHAEFIPNGQRYEGDLSFSNGQRIEGSLKIKTPVTGYDISSLSFNHEGTLRSFNNAVDLSMKGETIRLATVFSFDNGLNGEVTFSSPFEKLENVHFVIHHTMNDYRMYNHMELEYNTNDKIESDIDVSWNDRLQVKISVTTPFDRFETNNFELSSSGNTKKLRLSVKVEMMNQEMRTDIVFNNDRSKDGSLKMKTPIKGFENILVKYKHEKLKSNDEYECSGLIAINGVEELYVGFKHEGMMRNQKNTIDIRSSYMEDIQMVFNLKSGITHLTSLVELKMGTSNALTNQLKYSLEPNHVEFENSFNIDFNGFKHVLHASAEHTGHLRNFNNHISLQMNDDRYMGQSRLRTTGDFDGSLDIELPSWLQQYRQIHVSAQQKSEGERQENKLVLKSSMVDDVVLTFNRERSINRLASTIEARVGSTHVIRNQIACRIGGGNIDIDNKFNYDVNGVIYNIYATLKHTGPWYNSNNNIMLSINDEVYEAHSELSTIPTLNALIEIKTPMEKYRDMLLSLSHKLRNEGRRGISKVTSRLNGEEINGKLYYNVKDPADIKMELEISTPFTDARLMKISYNHDLSRTSWNLNGNMILNNDRIEMKSSGELKPSFAGSASIRTPFEGYRELSVNGKVDYSSDMLKAESSLMYGRGKTIGSQINVDRTSTPAQLNIRITTPFTDNEEMNLNAEYYGRSRNYLSTITITKSGMKPISLTGHMNYQSLEVMDCSFEVSSGLEYFDKLRFKIKNEEHGHKYSSYMMVGWNDNDKIVFEGYCEPIRSWGKYVLKSEMKLTTPFEGLRSFTVKANHDSTDSDKTANWYAEYNGRDLVDVQARYTFNDVHNANILVRQPRPMSFQVNGIANQKLVDGEVTLNLNGNNPIHVHSTLKNKNELNMKVSSAGRTVGFNGIWDLKNNHHNSNARIAVDEMSAGYAYVWRTHNGLESHKAKLYTPWRNMQLDSELEPSNTQNKYSAVFHWDADHDESKRVGAKMVVGSTDASNKLGLELELPSIGKDVKVETDLTLNNGRTILDGTTEVTYSKNSNRLKLFSRVEDVSRRYGQNYSFTLGIQHPATSIDIELSGTAGKSNDKYSASMDLQYLTAMRQRKNIALRGEIDQVKQMLDLEMVSPVKEIKLQGQVKTENPYGISFTSVQDKRKVVKGDLSINTQERTMKVTSNYDPENVNKVLEISGKYASKNIMAELSRFDGRYRTVDSLMSLSLNSSHLLHTRFHWRPTMLNEFKAYGINRLRIYNRDLQMMLAEISNSIRQESVQKYEAVSQHVVDELLPILALWKDVMTTLTDLERQVADMYWKNEMHVRSYTHNNLFLAKDMLVYYGSVKAKMEQLQTSIDHIEETRREIAHLISEKISSASQKVRECARNSMNDAITTFSNTMDALISESEFISSQLRLTYNTIKEHFNEMEYNLKNHPLMDTVSEKYQDLINQLPNAPNITMPEQYSSMIYNANNKLNSVLNRHGLGVIHSAGNEVYQQGKWAWNYWNIPANIKNLFKSAEKEAEHGVRMAVEKLGEQIAFDIQKSRIIVFNPEQGEIQLELYSPVAIKSFDSLPEVNIQAKLNKVKSYLPKTNYSFWDIYYNYIPPSNLKDLLPPFRGVAGVSDDRHFFTFDGSHFDFAGRCSYVLAKDMNGKFTIIANYDRSRSIESIQVLTDQSVIEMKQNGRIKINNRRAEIPNEIGNVTVRRLGEVIRIENQNNFQVDYDMVHNYYFVTVSGWYHGRIGGLLGSFDNEGYNDMMTAENEIAQNIEEFATSWEVASKCASTRNFARQITPTEDAEEQCRQFFEENNSVFRPCFGQVSPREFMHTCTNELMTGSGDACKTAAMYVRMCRNREVNIKVPRQCVRCQNPYGKRFIEGENITLKSTENTEPAVDVLFVAEEKMCNQKRLNKLDNLAKEIDAALRQKGIKDTKFAMLGYDIHDIYMHTMHGELFSSANKFAPDFKNLGKIYDFRGGEMNALMKAARYPFRTGAKKIVILVPCSECREEKYSYSDISRIYRDNDITTHLLTPVTFYTTSPNWRNTNLIHGYDNSKLYSVKDKAGTPEDRDRISIGGKNVCVDLAMQSGSVFNSMKMTQGRLQTQNDFINSFVTALVNGSTRTAQCQNCRCVPDKNGAGISECQKCSSVEYNFIPEMKNTTA